MSKSLEAKLDQLLESHISKPEPLAGGTEVRDSARLVKRTEVASNQQKRSMVKYIFVSIIIVMIIVAIIYFVAKTSHGKVLREKISSMLGRKRKKPHENEEYEEDNKRLPGSPTRPSRPTLQIPNLPRTSPVGEEPEELDPNAVRFVRPGNNPPPRPPPAPSNPPQESQSSQDQPSAEDIRRAQMAAAAMRNQGAQNAQNPPEIRQEKP